jgi:Type II secretion system (T2SS), protein M subtype b
MNAFFDLLTDKERRTLVRLGAAALLALAVFLVLLTRVRGGLEKQRVEALQLRNSSLQAVKARDEAKAEWRRWEEANRDLEELRSGYFYDPEEGGQALRLDLQQIFALAGTNITDLNYGYSDLEKEQVRKTVVTFTYGGTYAGLKKLLAVLEAFPKFLAIDKLEFPRTGSDGGRLSVRLTLAGYYGI